MRYYSIMRPVMPGSYPKKAAAQEIENFDEKTFCEEIGREAWGYIDYSEELTESEAADCELVPAKENKEEITNKIDALFEELVPASGKADTVAGEIIRAVCRIGYRWFNDGDMVGVGYGKETCNPAARYLAEKAGSRVERAISDMWGDFLPDDIYEKRLQTLNVEVLAFLDLHPELKGQPNSEDMWDYKDEAEDVDDDYEDDEEEYEEEDYEDEEDW